MLKFGCYGVFNEFIISLFRYFISFCFLFSFFIFLDVSCHTYTALRFNSTQQIRCMKRSRRNNKSVALDCIDRIVVLNVQIDMLCDAVHCVATGTAKQLKWHNISLKHEIEIQIQIQIRIYTSPVLSCVLKRE